MVLGLFKSKQKRIDEARERKYRETTGLLEKLNVEQRGAIALNCARIRLSELALFAEGEPEVREMARAAWYDPLQADTYTLKVMVDRLNKHKDQAGAQFVAAAGNEDAMTQHLLLLTAIEAHMLTMFASTEPVYQSHARQIWALIATGMPEVETLVARMQAADHPQNTPEVLAQTAQIVADGPDGPEYRRIPEGFAPQAA